MLLYYPFLREEELGVFDWTMKGRGKYLFGERGILKVLHVQFEGDQTKVILFVPQEMTRTRQIPGFAAAIMEAFPELRYHKCDNDKNISFIEELEDTEIAHVFEHVLLEMIGQADSGAFRIKGWTSWDWKTSPRWTYEVSLKYRNPHVFLTVLASTLTVFGELVDRCSVARQGPSVVFTESAGWIGGDAEQN